MYYTVLSLSHFFYKTENCGKNLDFLALKELIVCSSYLGNEHHILKDNSSLKSAPSGKDCVIAKGWNEPGLYVTKQVRIQVVQVTCAPVICKNIFEIDRKIF
jgi:hypothetical protein